MLCTALEHCGLDPGDVLRALRPLRRPFALVGRWAGSRAIVGAAPTRVVTGALAPPGGAAVADRADGGVGGGWVGFAGYRMAEQIERLDPAPPRPVALPEAAWAWHPWVLRLDREGAWWFEALADDADARAALGRVRRLLARPVERRPWSLDGMTLHGAGADGHRVAVAEAVERIAAGELFQANLCLRLDGRLRGSACDAFADAAAELRPAYGAFVGLDDGALLSFSPELFLRRVGREVETAPIKGTAPRPAGDAGDHARASLEASAKDAAEHVMIVDLMRNDLGRVARYGSVRAAAAPDVEPHPGLWHLVSRVRATLRPDVDDQALLRATFPPGSVTGAPKVQALKVISELEGTAREAYTGAIGFVSPCAGLELNVAIRTLEVRGERAWLGCGGGVVADSDPEAELREALGKARPIVAALGASVPETSSRDGELGASRVGVARRLPRPDPAAGVFTTLLVDDGVPVRLGAHLARLGASVAGLYGVALDGEALRASVLARAAAADPGGHRLRVDVLASGEVTLFSAPVAAAAAPPPELVPARIAGGLGAHKWRDRGPLDGLDGDARTALLVDLDGTVLESARANVWAIEGERLLTPPADGRLLPGVTRDAVLDAVPGAAEERLTLDRLAAADGIVLTSSIRLATAAALDGAARRRAATS